MNNVKNKKDLFIWLILIYIIPIILSIVMFLDWDAKNGLLMGIILGVIWLLAIIGSYFLLKSNHKNPYPFSYLLDYDTLIKYMQEEEKTSFDNKLEAGFHYYLYDNNEKVEVQSWHYTFSNSAEEKAKGNIYYWNKEEFNSLNSLIETHLKKFDNYVLIELADFDSVMLNEYKKNHPELDVAKYIENLNKK